MGIFHQLFPSSTSREAIAVIDAFVSGYDTSAADEVARVAKKLIRKNGPVTAPDGPRVVAIRLMQILAANRLRSGELHIYRGVLSLRGAQMLQLFDACVDMRQKIGDPEAFELAAITERAAIRHDIKQVG